MTKEIERKFLVKKIPDLNNLESISYERYFLYSSENIEIRIQKKCEKYQFERKEKLSNLSANKQKFDISKEEFDVLKQYSWKSIIRDSYLLTTNPEITLKIYHGRFEGLYRAEVEFGDEESAKNFVPFDWFGKEITNSPMGRDSTLLDLTEEEFDQLMKYNKDID